MVRAVPGLVAVFALSGAGCTHDGNASLFRTFGWDPVKTPRDPKIPPAHLATTERVESLGRQIIAQNAFTGIEPMFFTMGVPESVLFHRGPEELFISEGLAEQCKTDAELAGVLCAELGQMVAEKRATRRAGVDRDPIPDAALPGGASVAGGTPYDPAHDAEVALREKQRKKKAAALVVDAGEAAKLSRELLKGAGFDPSEFDRVEPLLRQSDRGLALRKQLSGTAPAPKWDR